MKARERPGPKCMSKSVRGGALEAFVWNDIKEFVKRPENVLEQLRSQKALIDTKLSEGLVDMEDQIDDLRRRERNLLRVASESAQVDIQSLDEVLGEIRGSLETLMVYRDKLKVDLVRGEALERELFAAADRLGRLQKWIDQASFEERRRAVEEFVKEIRIDLQEFGGKEVAVISVTYRFDEPSSVSPPAREEPAEVPEEFVTEAYTSRQP